MASRACLEQDQEGVGVCVLSGRGRPLLLRPSPPSAPLRAPPPLPSMPASYSQCGGGPHGHAHRSGRHGHWECRYRNAHGFKAVSGLKFQ